MFSSLYLFVSGLQNNTSPSSIDNHNPHSYSSLTLLRILKLIPKLEEALGYKCQSQVLLLENGYKKAFSSTNCHM